MPATSQSKRANMEKTFDIKEELKKLPDAPGVYIMHDKDDLIIYIGKAKSLTKRVHQYFQASHNEGIKKKQMVEHIDHFEYIVTDSELEALVLECNLIKEHTPKYNTMLRDDKTSVHQGDTGRGLSEGAVFASDEKGQIPLLWSVYECLCGEKLNRSDKQNL